MRSVIKAIQAAAGNAGEAVYVDDVFSTYLYKGNNTNPRSITNNIDLAGEGGMVWIKRRTATDWHVLSDTERGTNSRLSSNSTNAAGSGVVTAFNSDGFDVNDSGQVNFSGDYASWTFRKQPGFFDVVTYTGDGTTTKTVSHSLGSTPGMIVFKRTDSTGNWIVWHRSTANGAYTQAYLRLNDNFAATQLGDYGNSLVPTDSVIRTPVHSNSGNTADSVNVSGATYVAYIFAHDAQEFGPDEDESIIKCGTYTGNGTNTGPEINLGFEPQWLLVKKAEAGGFEENWHVFDTLRGWNNTGTDDHALYPNTSGTESSGGVEERIDILPYGFQPKKSDQSVNGPNYQYIYVAIRRPQKPASKFSATDLFSVQSYLGNGGTSTTAVIPSFSNRSIDLAFFKQRTQTRNWEVITRLTSNYPTRTNIASTSPEGLSFNTTSAEHTIYSFGTKNNRDISVNQDATSNLNLNSYPYVAYAFSRAPGFFDVVAYTGTGSVRTQAHNLGSVPEMVWIKRRDGITNWTIYAASEGNTKSSAFGSGAFSAFSMFNNTDPTASVFTLGTDGDFNGSGQTYIAYLFATVPGISKVGSYTGTGSDVNVDCGFSSGARFVLVKRTDSTGDWYLWDASQGIVSGNEGYFLINSSATQTTGNDYINPLSSGFTITSGAPAALNASGGTYIFLAIA